MDSDAFNSYCLSCDQLCSHNSVYCSNACKEKDENSAHKLAQSPATTDMASPLLTPSLYQHSAPGLAEPSASPLVLPVSYSDTKGLLDFSLNYSLSSPVTQLPSLSSTSQNYRLWLTGVM